MRAATRGRVLKGMAEEVGGRRLRSRMDKEDFPNISRWSERLPGLSPPFHLARLLTGHGTSPNFLWCPGAIEDVQHRVFECGTFTVFKTEVVPALGSGPEPEIVAEALCGPPGLIAVEDSVFGVSPIAKAMVARRRWMTMAEAILSDKEKYDRKKAGERKERVATTRRGGTRRRGCLQL